MKAKQLILISTSAILIAFFFMNCSEDSEPEIIIDPEEIAGSYLNQPFPTTTAT